jgi:hypothetical protein
MSTPDSPQRTTAFDIFVPVTETFTGTGPALMTKQNVEVTKTININVEADDFARMFNPYDDDGVFNTMNILDPLRQFFNIKSNCKMFVADLASIITYNYPNVSVNPRKLYNLCMPDMGIWDQLFLATTTLKHPEDSAAFTTVYQEIAFAIRDMVNQSEGGTADAVFADLISGDCITIGIRLSMTPFSTAAPILAVFVKINVVQSASQYTFALPDTSSL